jgi:putative membrane protein
MRHTLLILVVLALGFTGRAWAADPNRGDRDFVEKAAMGGMMEVELGRHASEHASNPAVRAFAQRMVTEHSKANAELTAVAKQQGIPVPAAMDDKHRKEISKLTEKRGTDFDEAYMKQMVDDHETDVDAFRDQAKEGKTEIDRFAAKTLPTLESHLTQAKSVKDSLKKHASR